jgi:hypothetical protein
VIEVRPTFSTLQCVPLFTSAEAWYVILKYFQILSVLIFLSNFLLSSTLSASFKNMSGMPPSKYISKGSDDGVQHSGILGFWTLDQWLRLYLSNGPNRAGVSHPSPEEGRKEIQFPNAVIFCVFYNTRGWTKSKGPVIQNPLSSYGRLVWWNPSPKHSQAQRM